MKNKIKDAASCLLRISDDWKYSDIKEHLNWLLDNPDEIAEGYPLDVMKRNYSGDILEQVHLLLNNK